MTEECRKAFEEWVAKINPVSGLGDALRKRPSGEYLWGGGQRAWLTWQAAFQAGRASAPAPEVTDEMVKNAAEVLGALLGGDWKKNRGHFEYVTRSVLNAAIGRG